jgi:hypothetical protein
LKNSLPPPKAPVPRLRVEHYQVRRQVDAMVYAREQFEEIEVLVRWQVLASVGPTRRRLRTSAWVRRAIPPKQTRFGPGSIGVMVPDWPGCRRAANHTVCNKMSASRVTSVGFFHGWPGERGGLRKRAAVTSYRRPEAVVCLPYPFNLMNPADVSEEVWKRARAGQENTR